MLKEFYEIQTKIKKLEAESRELREKLIAKGTHSERDFICEVTEQSRRSISLTEIEKTDQKLALTLDNKGLIKTSVMHVVKVLKKAAA